MTSTRPVLVATDLSESGDEAVRQAHRRATQLGSPLAAICVGSHTRDAIAARVVTLTGRPAAEVDVAIESGSPAPAIVACADALDAQLVVLGVHAPEERAPHPPLGPVVEWVMRHAHCPVLIARRSPDTRRVVVATDFSDPSLPAVEAAVRDARAREASLTILHCLELGSLATLSEGPFDAPVLVADPVVAELRQTALERLKHALERFDAEGEMVLVEGAPASAIPEEATERRADLLVIGTIGKSGLRRLLLGSVAEAVARRADCSVLVVRLHRGETEVLSRK